VKRMQIGKVSTSRLEKTVLSKISHHRKDILVNSGVGEDSAVVDFGEEVLAISSDPITGAGQQAGYLAVHVACNDLAAAGASPIGVQVVLLLPPEATDEMIGDLMTEINDTACSLGIQVLGGHTEVLSEVSKTIIVVTAIGRADRDKFVATGGARPGDKILLTKGVGLEGAFILAGDYPDYLLKQGVSPEALEEALSYQQELSVLPEGLLAASYGVNSLHDITEGGLYGALQEVCAASKCGFHLKPGSEIVRPAVAEICSRLGLNPLALISSGSMLITLPEAEELQQELYREGIKSFQVGEIVKERVSLILADGELKPLEWDGEDELWKFLGEI